MLQPTLVEFGFTGTRDGMSEQQIACVAATLQKFKGFVHHGDCLGSDAQFHDLAILCGYHITVHPPINESMRARKAGHVIKEPKAYLERDRNIVDSCKYLLATPKNMVTAHSGTWYTINYAMKKNIPTMIIMPNGDLYEPTPIANTTNPNKPKNILM